MEANSKQTQANGGNAMDISNEEMTHKDVEIQNLKATIENLNESLKKGFLIVFVLHFTN